MSVTKGKWEVDYRGTLGHIKAVGLLNTDKTPTVCRYDVITPIISEEEKKANANLIVTAVNACKEINPENPQAVAESIKGIYEDFSGFIEWLNRFVMKFYTEAENPTYEKMKKLYTELDEHIRNSSKVLAKAEEKL